MLGAMFGFSDYNPNASLHWYIGERNKLVLMFVRMVHSCIVPQTTQPETLFQIFFDKFKFGTFSLVQSVTMKFDNCMTSICRKVGMPDFQPRDLARNNCICLGM